MRGWRPINTGDCSEIVGEGAYETLVGEPAEVRHELTYDGVDVDVGRWTHCIYLIMSMLGDQDAEG